MHEPEALKHVRKNLATLELELKLLLSNTQPLGKRVNVAQLNWLHDALALRLVNA